MRAYLGLGSNLGDRDANLDEAVRRLDAATGVVVVKESARYNTAPVGGPRQPDYLNAACEVETELSPHELLHAALKIEDEMGRQRDVHWGPRIIDIDLLLAGSAVIDDEDLTLPHPRMTEREFVLRPLADVAPMLKHPVKGQTITALLKAVCPSDADDEA